MTPEPGGELERREGPSEDEPEALDSRIEEFVEGHVEEVLEQRVHEVVEEVVVRHYSGPIPSPEAFMGYEQALPGAADRILTMAEQQSAHRMTIERRELDSFLKLRSRGQVFGLLIVLAAIIAGTYLIADDKPVGGLVTIIGAIGILVGAFVISRGGEQQYLPEGPEQQSAEEDEDEAAEAD